MTPTTDILALLRERGEIPTAPLDEAPREIDPEVFLAEEIAPVLKQLIADANAGLSFDATGPEAGSQIGAMAVAEELHGCPPRLIYRVLSGESPTVGLDVADRLLLAFESNISRIVHAGLVQPYRRSELREAQALQLELMCTVARCRGEYVPPVGQRKSWPESMRRKWSKEARAA